MTKWGKDTLGVWTPEYFAVRQQRLRFLNPCLLCYHPCVVFVFFSICGHLNDQGKELAYAGTLVVAVTVTAKYCSVTRFVAANDWAWQRHLQTPHQFKSQLQHQRQIRKAQKQYWYSPGWVQNKSICIYKAWEPGYTRPRRFTRQKRVAAHQARRRSRFWGTPCVHRFALKSCPRLAGCTRTWASTRKHTHTRFKFCKVYKEVAFLQ